MGNFTTNYLLFKPEPLDSMAAFETNFNQNWDKITAVPGPDVVTGVLPQSGSYNLGSRIYRTDDSSIYLLITKDANWGWFWRPVHAAISPWITVPDTARNLSGWTLAADASNPFAIALDNRGNCYWRGSIGVTAGLISRNTSHAVLKNVPIGIRPRQSSMYMLGHHDFGAATGEIEGARIFIPESDTSNTIRLQGTGTNAVTKVYLDGNVHYAVGTAHYFTP